MGFAQSVYELSFRCVIGVSRVQHPGDVVEVGVAEDGVQGGERAVKEAQDGQGRDARAELSEGTEVRVAAHLDQAVLDPLHGLKVLLCEDVAVANVVEQQQILRGVLESVPGVKLRLRQEAFNTETRCKDSEQLPLQTKYSCLNGVGRYVSTTSTTHRNTLCVTG